MTSKLVNAQPSTAFDGLYMGAMVGFTAAGEQSSRPVPNFSYASSFGGVSNGPRSSQSINPVGGVFAGYGLTSDRLYLGAELRGDVRDQRRSDTTLYGATLGGNSPFVTIGYNRQTAKVEKGIDASARLGLVLGDWLAFGRVGGGVAHLTGRLANVSFFPGVLAFGSPASAVSEYFSPYILFGAGLERSFGQYFVRVEGEVLSYLGSSSSFAGPNKPSALSFQHFYDGRFTLAAGYRW